MGDVACGCAAVKYRYDQRWDDNANRKLSARVQAEMAGKEGQKSIHEGCASYLRGRLVLISSSAGTVVAILSALGVHLTSRQKEQLQKIVIDGLANGNGKGGKDETG